MRLIRMYLKSYSGLTAPAWMLAFVLLINRSGSMVLPFLSLYLKDELNLSIEDVAFILTMFGFGSLVGSYLGGHLTDKIGTFAVQFWSLLLTAVGFVFIAHLRSVTELAIGFFVITVISDSFRPANAAAVAKHAKPENLTRAYSLNRMAINLGFAVGPAVGGMLAAISYGWLFYVDAISCGLAAIVFALYFYKRRFKKAVISNQTNLAKAKSPFKDFRFVLFTLLTVGYGIVFFQFLFTLPVYYRDYYLLSESSIGWLLGLNGLVVFALEMPLVYIFGKRFSLRITILGGCLLLVASFMFLNLADGILILIIAMVLLSLSEILVMPFLTTYTANRGGEASRGKYLGMYSMGYSVSFIVAPALGLFMVKNYDFHALWWLVSVLGVLVGIGYYYLIPPGKLKTDTEKVLDNIKE